MKLSEIKQGLAYAYNPYNTYVLNDATTRVVAVKVGVSFHVDSWRGRVSYRGARVRSADGKEFNVEARRLLAPWSVAVRLKAEKRERVAARDRMRAAQKRLAGQIEASLRGLFPKVEVEDSYDAAEFRIRFFGSDYESDDVTPLVAPVAKLCAAVAKLKARGGA